MLVTVKAVEGPANAGKARSEEIEIQTPSGFVIKIPPEVDYADLREVLAAFLRSVAASN